MAKTKFVYLQGKAKWVRAHQPDAWGNFKMDLYPNAESLEKLREMQAEGLKNVIKKDEDGYYTTFRRPQQKMIKGKVLGFAPPEVLEADGKTPLRDCLVGNGSDVTIKLEYYEHQVPGGGKGKAARLASIRVDNLIPFTGERDFDEDTANQVRGLSEQPPQLF